MNAPEPSEICPAVADQDVPRPDAASERQIRNGIRMARNRWSLRQQGTTKATNRMESADEPTRSCAMGRSGWSGGSWS